MSALFSSPKTPAPTAPAPAPLVDPTQVAQQQQAAANEQLQASAGGKASTLLTSGGGLGDPNFGKNSVAKTLGIG
jgi:hypothetical protein